MLTGTPNVLEYCNNSNIAMAKDRWRCGGLKQKSKGEITEHYLCLEYRPFSGAENYDCTPVLILL